MSDDVLKPQVDPWSIFVQTYTHKVAGPVTAHGPLGALRLAVKDLFDIAGTQTGAGNPDWLATHGPATKTALCVERLVEAGMIVVGKTITDELAWSLNGRNAHYGTPPNTRVPGRLPGGSSSGSAAAVVAGLADIALGTDTGGSVRLPASYCGLWGIRPSHGRVPAAGLVNLAPSYDVPGWFADDPALLLEAGRVLLDDADFDSDPDAPRLVLATEIWESASTQARDALARPLRGLERAFGGIGTVSLAGTESLSTWRATFATLQAAEAWEIHGAWITRTRPTFGPDIAQRFEAASRLDPAAVEAAKAHRAAIVRRLDALLIPGTIIVMPTVPGPAPFLDTSNETLDAYRLAAIEGLCAAGHGGLPQLSMPVAHVDGAPLGLSILGPRGSDERLLTLATRIAELLPHA